MTEQPGPGPLEARIAALEDTVAALAEVVIGSLEREDAVRDLFDRLLAILGEQAARESADTRAALAQAEAELAVCGAAVAAANEAARRQAALSG